MKTRPAIGFDPAVDRYKVSAMDDHEPEPKREALFARITRDPAVMAGKPCVKGTRMPVDFVLNLLAGGWSVGRILENYPSLKHDDVSACLAYAADFVAGRTSSVRRSVSEAA